MEFKLLKDLPYQKAGAIYTRENHNPDYYNTNGGEYRNRLSKKYVENNSEWFERIDNCVFNHKRIHDRLQELKEQEAAFNAARKGLKNGEADERTFHGEYYKDFNDYQIKKFVKELNDCQLKYFHKLTGTYCKKEIWQGIVSNVSDLLKNGVSKEEIDEYLKPLF